MDDEAAVVSLADVARIAGVTRPAVSNWRRRYGDFPDPVEETGAIALFRRADVERWLIANNKPIQAPSLAQIVWSVLNRDRGSIHPEDAMEAGLLLLGCKSLASQFGALSVERLRSAVEQGHEARLLEEAIHGIWNEAAQRDLIHLDIEGIDAPRLRDSLRVLRELYILSERFGVAPVFEALVDTIPRVTSRAGDQITPRTVAELMASLSAPIRGTVLDLACGRGSLLLAASRHAERDHFRLLGQDVNRIACRTTELRMRMHGLPAQVSVGDTLTHDALGGTLADVVFADPPFGAGWHPTFDSEPARWAHGRPPPSRADLAWIQHAISRLRPDGLGILILPPASLFRRGAEQHIRQSLVARGFVQAVIALPVSLYPNTNIGVVAWIVAHPPLGETPGVLLVDASGLGQRRHNHRELADVDVRAITECFQTWRRDGAISSRHGLQLTAVSVTDLLDNDCDLSPARWLTASRIDPQQQLHEIGGALRELQEANDVLRPINLSSTIQPGIATGVRRRWTIGRMAELGLITTIRPRRIHASALGRGSTPLIRGKDLGLDLQVVPSDSIDLELAADFVELTQPGDVLVLTEGRVRAAVDWVGGSAVASPVHVVRPISVFVDPLVLAALITRSAPRYAAGTVIPRVSLDHIEVLDMDQESIRLLRRALDLLLERRRNADRVLRAVDHLTEALTSGIGSGAVQLSTGASTEQVR